MRKVLLLVILTSNLLLGRDILIGDKMNFEIKGVSKEDAAEAFEGFEVEEVREDEGKVWIGVRTYETGKKVVEIGDKRLIVHIKSSLKEGEDKIIPNLTDKSDIVLSEKKLPLSFYAGGTLLAISLGLLALEVIKGFKKKEMKSKSPEEKFYEGIKNTGGDYMYEVSYLLREYVDALTGSNLLRGRYEESGAIDGEVLEFLKEMDHCKFAKEVRRGRAEVVESAKKMAEKIEEKMKGVEKGV